jgi:hypothetical protein
LDQSYYEKFEVTRMFIGFA